MRREQSLLDKLDGYQAYSGDDATAGKQRQSRWALYATAAGSGLALTTAVEAGIVYSNVQNLSATVGTPGSVFASNSVKINIDGKGGNSFVLRVFHDATFGIQYAHADLKGGSHGAVLSQGFFYAQNLAPRAKISSMAGNFGSEAALARKGFVFSGGYFAEGKPGIAGVHFTNSSGGHFGWVRLSWKSNGTDGLPNTVTAIDWAYETGDNVPILAGDTGQSAVPEPSTGVLGLLATGCTGVLAWRRRNRPVTARPQADAVLSS